MTVDGVGGKPLKFKTPEEFQEKIDAYFDGCIARQEPFTVTGLALALDTTRKTLVEYEDRPAYRNAIKRAKTRVENYAEIQLFGKYPTGAIFALKNFGWSDGSHLPRSDNDEIEEEYTLPIDEGAPDDAVL